MIYSRKITFLIIMWAQMLSLAAYAQDIVTLEDALAEAYQVNPELRAAQAELRSVDELYAQAVAGYRPVITGDASYLSSHQEGDNQAADGDPKALSLGIVQPLYRGGSTQANVESSDNKINAQRAILNVTEQRILLAAVTAYMNVIRDQKIVGLNLSNEKVLARYLDASRQRFKVGDITKTDVSQAESRLSNAIAGRVRAEGDYLSSRAEFERVIGLPSDRLQTPEVKQLSLPAALEDALAEAEKNNPNVLYARYTSAAAEASARAIIGEMRPQLDLNGSLGKTYDPAQSLNDHVNTTVIGLTATIPLYTGGATDSRVRQARQVEQQRRMDISTAERSVEQAVVKAWADLGAANAEVTARTAQIEAAQLALDGVKIEADYGSRTTLNVLDAEQEYLDAQVAYATAERGKIVSAYGLLAAVGALNAKNLEIQAPLYDATANFQKIKNKWIGTQVENK